MFLTSFLKAAHNINDGGHLIWALVGWRDMSFRRAIQERVANKILASFRSSVKLVGAQCEKWRTLFPPFSTTVFSRCAQLTERQEEVEKNKKQKKNKLVRPIKLE